MRVLVLLGVLALGLASCAQPNKSEMVTVARPQSVASLVAQANAGNDKAAIALFLVDIRSGNPTGAFHWIKLAADRGSAVGQAGVGMLYASGIGVPQDYTAALKYDRLSAAQNNAAGLNNLAWLNEKGFGLPINAAEAARLYRRSAMLGNPVAQASMGRFYDQGIGVHRDPRLAYFWYNLAAAKLVGKAEAVAIVRRDALARELPAEAVAALQSAASVWRPGTEPPAPSQRAPMRSTGPSGSSVLNHT